MICLRFTKTLDEEALRLPEWLLLKEDYKLLEKDSSVNRAIVTIINSIIYQRRVVFCLTRRLLRQLVTGDNNWKKRGTLANEKYSDVLKALFKWGYVEKVEIPEKSNPRGILVLRLVDKDFLEFVKVSEETQLSEVIKFIEEDLTSKEEVDRKVDRKVDRRTDQVVSSKVTSNSNRKANSKSYKKDHKNPSLEPTLEKQNPPGDFSKVTEGAPETRHVSVTWPSNKNKQERDRVERLQSLPAHLYVDEIDKLENYHLGLVKYPRRTLTEGKLDALSKIEARLGPKLVSEGMTKAEDERLEMWVRLQNYLREFPAFYIKQNYNQLEQDARETLGDHVVALAMVGTTFDACVRSALI